MQTWAFSNFANQLDLPAISLAPVAAAGTAVFGAVSGLLSVVGGGLGTAVFGYALWWLLRKWWANRPQRYSKQAAHPHRRRIFSMYRRAQRHLRSYRRPAQTVQEHAASHPELTDLAHAVDIAAYRPTPPNKSLLAHLQSWWHSIFRRRHFQNRKTNH